MNRSPVRSLVDLDRGGSSSRVLNLNKVHRRDHARPISTPFFRNAVLDHSIILKHQLRAHERELFSHPRSIATKIILPLDNTDLRLGGRSFFVGEDHYESILAAHFGSREPVTPEDRLLLQTLDALPSLDPFLLREALTRHSIVADLAYFNISESDLQAMRDVVERDIARLASLAASPQAASILTERLLFRPAEDYEPLRRALHLSETEYAEGLFAWRGLLYYKWRWGETMRVASQTYFQVAQTPTTNPRSSDVTASIKNSLAAIDRRVGVAFREVNDIIELYETYYRAFIDDRDPAAFKAFVMKAPQMFFRSGELIGGVQHVVSYWAHRSQDIARTGIGQADFAELLAEFEASLCG